MRNLRLHTASRLAAIGALAVGFAGAAHAQYNSDNPGFPGVGVSFEITSLDTIVLGGNTMTGATFYGFDNSLAYSAIPVGTTSLAEHISFDAVLNGVATHFTGTETLSITPEAGVLSNGVGAYNTQITALSVSNGSTEIGLGTGGSSLGTATVSVNNGGGGAFHVDSFFNVFTEISMNNGATWTQSSGSNRFNDDLGPPAATPEPITMGLGIAGLGFAIRRVRSRSK